MARYSEQPLGWQLIALAVYITLMTATYLGIRYFFLHVLPIDWTHAFGAASILYAVLYYTFPLWRRLGGFARIGWRRGSPNR